MFEVDQLVTVKGEFDPLDRVRPFLGRVVRIWTSSDGGLAYDIGLLQNVSPDRVETFPQSGFVAYRCMVYVVCRDDAKEVLATPRPEMAQALAAEFNKDIPRWASLYEEFNKC